VLTANDLVAICGDSITEQQQYSVFIENYLLMCQPKPKLSAMQFGWGGETAGGFLGRMSNVLRFPVTVATTCYGMNDGRYGPINDEVRNAYRDGTTKIVDTFKKSGVRVVVVGSPGVVDSKLAFGKDPAKAAVYNQTLAALRDIARDVAKEQGVLFADVHAAMADAMAKAKAKYGEDYEFAGADGVHPNKNGQLVMAYAFLKAMGCDGDIGAIKFDLAANKAEGSEGHKVISAAGGAVEIESSRYPFCFFGDPKTADSTRGIIEFFPFNQDLNRYQLIVTNPGAEKLKVTWGLASKDFSAADLAKGINLAAEFLDNPFAAQFVKVESVVRQQQAYETPLIKNLLHNLPTYIGMLPEQKESWDKIVAGSLEKDKVLREAASAAVVPVKHTIKVEKAP
jgi:lysophospholipase L1-like esterase